MREFLVPKAKATIAIILGIAFFMSAIIQCHSEPPPPKKMTRQILAMDGTSHPFRDTLIVYRERVVKMPPDTLVKYIRVLVRDTLEVPGDTVSVPVETVRKVAVRILSDSIKLYQDSVRIRSDSLYIRDLQNTPPDIVFKCPETWSKRLLERGGLILTGIGIGLIL